MKENLTEAEMLTESLDIILENILTPIIYMYYDEVIEFIVFCDSRASDDLFKKTAEIIYFNLGLSVEIVDIRDFSEEERTEIVFSAHLAYSESDLLLSIFQTAAATDQKKMMAFINDSIKRKKETGTYYTN